MAGERDILRILVATDNHLGVWEADDVRKNDSFNSFEEVFEIAAAHNADLVLLGGDLFHDNKPSRQTVVKAMEILNRHCLNDRPITFQILSDQKQNFSTGIVNFANPNLNIGLPVFTIHGNHDDPAGSDNLSAVDILATSSLVNYFGKTAIVGEGAGKVRITPILFKKGDTKVALYGLGNLRDERLGRLFATPNSVEWVRPAPVPGICLHDWFNIFVLHQNRIAHTQGAKNCVREGHLAKFLDLVVWGHEHECLADPWESIEGNGYFSVMQPGSSVATALSEGESKKKHVVLVEIQGQNWRTSKHPLETVRPFAFDSVSLSSGPGTDALDPDNPETIAEFLTAKVTTLIERARQDVGPRTPDLPLIRLRVDYTGFSTINTQRFGQKFVGKVANPQDMILWQKNVVRRSKAQREATAAAIRGAALANATAVEEIKIEDLIEIHMREEKTQIIPEVELTDALKNYVEKGEARALEVTVETALDEIRRVAEGGEEAEAILQGKRGEKQLEAAINFAVHKRKEEALAAAQKRRAEEKKVEAIETDAMTAANNGVTRSGFDAPTAAVDGDEGHEENDMFADSDNEPVLKTRGRGGIRTTTSTVRKRRINSDVKPVSISVKPRDSLSNKTAAKQRRTPQTHSPNDSVDDDEDFSDPFGVNSEGEEDAIVGVSRHRQSLTTKKKVVTVPQGRACTSQRKKDCVHDNPILIDDLDDENKFAKPATTNGRGRDRGGDGGRSQLTHGRHSSRVSQQTSRWGSLK